MIKRKRRKQNLCTRFFRRIRISFLLAQRRAWMRDYHVVRISILECIPDEYDLSPLYDYIATLLSVGFQLRVVQLPEQSTNGHIGYLSFWHGGKLEHRAKLMILKEVVETTKLSFQKVDE